ncbi:hypothetical protein ACFOU2_09605 [Bacillus songklensis]|uniref:ESAT-6 secretion machinery protein EssA n=1 Tax=Bacillus songklensis TaxID=1069116 RepID=A0ABV8B393_9BACI
MEEMALEKKIYEHEAVINDNILPRLEGLELEHAQFKQEMASLKTDLMGVQKGQKELELTVMKDGKETRELLKPFADHVLKQVEFESQTEKDIQLKKMDTREKIFLSIFGTGGLAGIVAAVVTFFK